MLRRSIDSINYSKSRYPLAHSTAALALACLVLAGCGENDDDENPEVEIEAVLAATTPPPTAADIAPYDEALVVNEYDVSHVLRGKLDRQDKTRVARWAVLGGKEQAPAGDVGSPSTMTLVPLDSVPGLDTVRTRNDLPFNPDESLYLDLTQSLAAPALPEQLRFDYRGYLSPRMRTYWAIRPQLRLVVIGNSHAACAVAPRLFYQPENETTPVAMSLSPAGSGMALQSLLVHEYLADLPVLEWVIWGLSPRILNERNAHDRRHELFTGSPGYRYDRDHRDELWPVETDASAPPLTVAELREHHGIVKKPWGWSAVTESDLTIPLDAAEEKRILHQARKSRFQESVELWTQLESAITELTGRGIKVLLFTPPYHPLVAEGRTADTDGTGHDDYQQIVARLESLAENNPLLFFEDIHRGGRHDFPHEEFSDADHLLAPGALRLTDRLVDLIEGEAK